MIIITQPHNAPVAHRYLITQIAREGHMRIARCERREHADNIARAWRDRIYTIPGEVRTWTFRDLSFSESATSGIA